METNVGMMQFEDRGRELQERKECGQPLEARRADIMDSPLEPPEECSPADNFAFRILTLKTKR